jgi:photosystem II stability/assembly factor-like uncharacterized protein
MHHRRRTGTSAALIPIVIGVLAVAGIEARAAPLTPVPAVPSAAAVRAPLLGAARAGKRLVAVGDYGTILLSDDDGRTFRQAAAVPVSSTLTAVDFADERNGWAVGHWGVILGTSDGGEHWVIQRLAVEEDRPLFSVHFVDAKEGIAVGLWSLILRTADGGSTWQKVVPPASPDGGKADRNLFCAFASREGALFVAAERGAVLRSDDKGATWRYLLTGYNGSFWSGAALQDGILLVAGLRGTVYRSVDGGKSWRAVDSGIKSSITDLVELNEHGRPVVRGVGLDGTELASTDSGASFTASQREDRLSLTAAVAASDRLVRFSVSGLVNEAPAGSAGAGK